MSTLAVNAQTSVQSLNQAAIEGSKPQVQEERFQVVRDVALPILKSVAAAAIITAAITAIAANSFLTSTAVFSYGSFLPQYAIPTNFRTPAIRWLFTAQIAGSIMAGIALTNKQKAAAVVIGVAVLAGCSVVALPGQAAALASGLVVNTLISAASAGLIKVVGKVAEKMG